MSSHQQRLGRVTVNSTLVVILVLVAILSPFVSAPATNVAAIAAPAAARPHAGQAPTESWLITWDASTSGSGSYSDEKLTVTILRQSHVTASIVVNYYADGTSEYYANEYTATYLREGRSDGICGGSTGSFHSYSRVEVMDPTHYSGTGPIKPNTVIPAKPTPWVGTKWTMSWINLELGGLETSYRSDNVGCGNNEHYYTTSVDTTFEEYLTSVRRAPFNSENGPLFLYDVDTSFEVDEGYVHYMLYLKEHLRVELTPGRDLTVRDVEVTQGLQLHNTIPLVQGRRTIVRAYIDIGTEPGPIADVTGRLRVYSGGTLLGELAPFNMAGSIYAKRVPDWQQIDDTLNWELPWLWTQLPSLRKLSQ